MKMNKVYLSNNLKKRFSFIEEHTGYVAGWEIDGEQFCMGILAHSSFILPGLEKIGLFCLLDKENASEDELLSICGKHYIALKLELENPLVLFVCKRKDENNSLKIFSKIFSTCYNSFDESEIVDLDYNTSILMRACGQIPLMFEISADIGTLKENIELAVEKIRTVVISEIVAFRLQNSSFILHRFDDQALNCSKTCKELLQFLEDSDLAEKIVKSEKNLNRKHPINFDILMQTTGHAALENSVNHSIVIHCQRRKFQCVTLYLPLDVLVVSQETNSTYAVYKLLVHAIEQQLEKMSHCLLRYAESTDFTLPVPNHFYPDMWDFPVTVIYPYDKTDQELEDNRRLLHKQLLLPLDRPFLKKLNAYTFSNVTASGCLINPHEGLGPSGVLDGRTSLVQGRYSYHHYMQDHVNDNGWGCAYRSLQTIVSWFKYQGYTDKSIPTHTEIQQALIDVGDKPLSFVGTKQWIGSQEVSFCLNHLIQVESKILFVNSGAEMASKGRELFNHFYTQGTPVMIGGGSYAHTIIGVDFNAETGDLKFLILDPHYTGSENISIIQKKGWCGWKSVQFWDQTAFYNMCLPLRPQQI